MSVFISNPPVINPPPRYACTRIQPPAYTPKVKPETRVLERDSLSISSSLATLTSPSITADHSSTPPSSSRISDSPLPNIAPPVYQCNTPIPRYLLPRDSASTSGNLESTISNHSTPNHGPEFLWQAVTKTGKLTVMDHVGEEMDFQDEQQQKEETGEGQEAEKSGWCCCLPLDWAVPYEQRNAVELTWLYLF